MEYSMSENRTIAILGATGSVGTQALDVARRRGYRVDFISSDKSVAEAEGIARSFSVRYVAMADENAARDLKIRLADTDIKVFSGEAGIECGILESSADSIVNAITGKAGLLPTLSIIEKGARLCLANKESLVIAGDTVMSRARAAGVEIIPVDSEHSAIFQSLCGSLHGEVKKIILTASGGPFFGKTREQLRAVTAEDTLKHPTWKMGKRITVDSATLMNKGFEIIEAVHLFDVPREKVEVVVHPESILHSAVEYVDNAVIGQLSVPDMRLCIQYALDYPSRISEAVAPLDFFKLGSLSFKAPDTEAFPLLSLAGRASSDGGAMGAVLNAADEVAVSAFLGGKIGFLGISDTVRAVYEKMLYAKELHSIDEILAADAESRKLARSIVGVE